MQKFLVSASLAGLLLLVGASSWHAPFQPSPNQLVER